MEYMSETPLSEAEKEQLLRSLFYKEGNWVNWGQACQKLQKAGYSTQDIFEQTGFQGSQQNLIIVAAQVYDSLVKAQVNPNTLTYFQGPRSDILYELRILTQEQRAEAALLAQEKNLDVDETRDMAKALQTFARLAQVPAEFTRTAGDAVAYQYWKQAKQKKDLPERARLIAKGLKFAHSAKAREAIEKLLSDFSVTPAKIAPLLPLYRLEAENELARIIPLVGAFPLRREDLEKVSAIAVQEPFRQISLEQGGQFVPLPGWQAVLKARDPVAIVAQTADLPSSLAGLNETVLVVVDRGARDWDEQSYFLVDKGEILELAWFAEAPNISLWGQVVLILRPKRILDENNILEPWQMDD
jgi:hypothetical protein